MTSATLRRASPTALGLLLLATAGVPTAACQVASETPAVDAGPLLEHVQFLASGELAGRASGSPGNDVARQYIINLFREVGLTPLEPGDWTQEFSFGGGAGGRIPAANVLGMIEGAEQPDEYIVVTAHFDHLGQQGSLIYHGADDNASGTAGLIEIARYFGEHPPRHSLIFAALDAEEHGLVGARHFVANAPVPLEDIILNVNLDMVSRNQAGELYVAGTHHYPRLTPLVDEVARHARVRLLKGHDRPDGAAGDDWTNLSDQGAFHAEEIPFLYFGVEDHADYHRPTDTFERIEPDFFAAAVNAVLGVVIEADENL